ncbi:hypothetical protein [Algisphaera agarilytica]|uniref:Uncharacterized protein n=1 Tax=Algisphaera agarilytica TaxID=1385975 RepID=A0A7X0LLS1_9BACT|nr:hypothetical protein [Algisphaera agarilytica]MBB6431312.1 hypothetical protein [Algisphaera agarilytica]
MNDQAKQPEPTPSQTRAARRRSWRGYVLLGLILVLGVALIRMAWLVRATPAYWQDHQAFLIETPEQDLQNLAADIQSKTLREWSYPIGEGDGLRTVRYNFDEINAWLATRLRPLMKNQNIAMPDEIGEVMLTQRSGDLVLAFDYQSGTLGTRIASFYFRFESENGQPLSAAIASAKAGEQPLLVKHLIHRLSKQPRFSDEQTQKTLARLGQKKLVPLPPIPVDDNRSATILDIDIQPEGIDLTIQVAFHEDE